MTLAARAAARNGVWPIPSGVMIETRGVTGSLFLRAWHEFNGETYEIRRGVSGKVVLAIFVERGTGPWLRRSDGFDRACKIGETLTIRRPKRFEERA